MSYLQMIRVHGRCPMGCGHTLFLGAAGHVTCSFLGCPDPGAADQILSSAVSSPEDGESTTADAGGMGGPRAAPGTTSRSAG